MQIWTHCLLAQDASLRQYIYWRSADIPNLNSSADFFNSLWRQFATFCLFVRTLPIDFALLGWKRKYIKSKTTVKLKGKQTSIAAVRDQFLSFAGLPDTLSFSLSTTCQLFTCLLFQGMHQYIYDRCSYT
jgi:hypothetical protein